MDLSFISRYMVLLQAVSVIIVAAIFISKSRYLNEVLEGRPTRKSQIILLLFFGAVSIYGSVIGIDLLGARINVRDLGPLVGGLACGPLVGLGAGLIGAAYRVAEGGFTVLPCSLAVLIGGILGGLVYLRKGMFPGVMLSVALAVLFELFHMGLVLLLASPYSLAMDVVRVAMGPMVLANGAGMFIFALIISGVISERETRAERDRYQKELQRKQAELAVAADIHKSLLPDIVPSIEGFDIAAASIPAREVGGDFYDFITGDGGKLCMVIADVSGKSIPAALFMALSRVVVRVSAAPGKSAAEALRDSNRLIVSDSGSENSGMFVTLFFAAFSSGSREMIYANAGHNPPLIFRTEEGALEKLEVTGAALGMINDLEYEERQVAFHPGDVLVMYTDGVVEAMNGNEELFGLKRLESTIKAAAHTSSKEIMERILEDISLFRGFDRSL
jgi:sigma-B regulation protein RsbU (phosphoserine phosphatase)